MKRHFTATAFIIDSQNRTLLLWHKRLQRWMPPGGHVEPDELPEETAIRECKEETGLDVDIIGGAQADLFANNPSEGQMLKKPIAMLLENIPDCPERSEPAHQHIDFLFVARPRDEKQSLQPQASEDTEIHWFSKEEVAALNPNQDIFANVQDYILSTLSY